MNKHWDKGRKKDGPSPPKKGERNNERPFEKKSGERKFRAAPDGERPFPGPDRKKDEPFSPRKGDKGNDRSFEKRSGDQKFRSTSDQDKTFPAGDRKKDWSKPKDDRKKSFGNKDDRPFSRERYSKPRPQNKDKDHEPKQPSRDAADGMPLNKYLAHGSTGSRRDTVQWIKDGNVTVNGEVMLTPGYRVQPKDVVTYNGKVIRPQRDLVYVLLNKPKDFITTTEDDRGRRTVMELVAQASEGRLFPIGRLDRQTTGVLLLTNDGDLAQRLSHPKYEARKIYQVSLDKDLTANDFAQIQKGVELEDGIARVDEVSYLETKNEIGVQLHSGRNRVVRRIFETLGYEVMKLDRVMYAGLTKKNVPRGKWRFLTDQEVIHLKHFKS